MASVTKSNDQQSEADEELPDEEQQAAERPRKKSSSEKSKAPEPRKKVDAPFFTIYKRGQGYWTRMGTALGAAFIAALTADFVYVQMKAIPYATDAAGQPLYIAKSVCAGSALGVLAIILFFVWRAMNKPSNADFLIATDSEMKKVNWTTRKELIGSTRVVIFFVILISALLFFLDVVFGYFFHLIKVLEFGPFQ